MINIAKTDTEAKKRFVKNRRFDPYPEIDRSLLNSGDIIKYIEKTGMIYPFEPNSDRLKSASYQMGIGSEVKYWNENSKEIHLKDLKPGDSIIFKPNSITYVTTDAIFRVPDYIALRFNLTIRHVHRGILLGTGPLIDPGFQGRIVIPIHNLTPNEYRLSPNEDLITVEFTKLSSHEYFRSDKNSVFYPYKPSKIPENVEFSYFLKKSLRDLERPMVKSSIGQALDEFQRKFSENSNELKEKTEELGRLFNRIRIFGVISTIALGVALFQLYGDIHSLISDSNKYVADAENLVSQERDLKQAAQLRADAAEAKNKSLENKLDSAIHRIQVLENKIAKKNSSQ